MPLTEEERIYFRSKIGQTPSPGPGGAAPVPTPTGLPATLPPYITSQTIPKTGIRVNYPPPVGVQQQEIEQERAKRKMQAETPLPTETERERTPMAQTSVAFLDQFAQQLGIDPAGKTLRHPEKLASPLVRELVPQKFQDYAMSEESSILYNSLESAFQLGSVVLTGRQGDLQKLQQIRDVYSFGGAVKDKPKLAAQRYQNLRRLFQTFDRAQQVPPEQQQTMLNQASQQMDTLLQGKPLAPALKPEEADIVKRLLSAP